MFFTTFYFSFFFSFVLLCLRQFTCWDINGREWSLLSPCMLMGFVLIPWWWLPRFVHGLFMSDSTLLTHAYCATSSLQDHWVLIRPFLALSNGLYVRELFYLSLRLALVHLGHCSLWCFFFFERRVVGFATSAYSQMRIKNFPCVVDRLRVHASHY